MDKSIAKRLIPIFKADVKKYRRQAQQANHKAESMGKHPNRHDSRYIRKLLLFGTCNMLLAECYNTLKL